QVANRGTAAPYGDDDCTRAMQRRCAEVFERPVTVFPMSTGTGTNGVALAALASAYGSVLCHPTAHINVYECGAPELFTGAKLVGVGGRDFKVGAQELESALAGAGFGNPTRVQPFALNLTQPTDFGSLYTLQELHRLAELAHGRGLRVHMDGARFANAVAALGCTPAELTWRSGVDLLSLGATKNGALNAEALVVFDEALAARIPYLMKRGGQVLSKARFVSAQLERYFADGLWIRRAQAANRNAAGLAERLCSLPGVDLVAPVQVNMIFLRVPERALVALRAGPFAFYELGEDVRLVCRHDQEPEGMTALCDCVRDALGAEP
ncbi:MAG TPA: beta-eliminating lyase-related protein, partial [Steroidobacteraceae bacterium]|nr:beta-eliminating lyase-related protein [Steroidobacteraceae bacterium]